MQKVPTQQNYTHLNSFILYLYDGYKGIRDCPDIGDSFLTQ